MKKVLAPTTVLCLAVATVTWGTGPNLILNGDFEGGNAYFTTDYEYVPPPYDPFASLWPEGTYTVDDDPHDSHDNFWSFGDHTTGSGEMLIANGHPEADQRVWEQTTPVFSNAFYVLTYYLSSCVPDNNPASIQCSVNGAPLGSVGAPPTPGTWTEVSYFWSSGTNGSATIALLDMETALGGNDFVIDDISFCCIKIAVPIDIKPTSCPNPLNVGSKGVLPVAILGTPDLDVTVIDPASVKLEGIAPLRWSIEDVATPIANGAEECDCTTEGPDGFDDLTLKFDMEEVVDALDAVNDGDVQPLSLTGNLRPEYGSGTMVEGSDCVAILKKDKPK